MNNEISRAIDLIRSGQLMEANIKQIIDHLPKYDEDDDELLFVLGDLLDATGEQEDALTIFKHLYDTNKHDDNLLAYIVDIYITEGNIDAALLLLNEAKETPTALMLKAEVFQQMHLNDVALKHLLKAREITNDLIVDFAIAELYFYDGNLVEAAYYYKNVLEEYEHVNNINVNLRLANIYTNLMESDVALNYFNAVKESEFENSDFFLKGVLHFQIDQLEESERLLDIVIKNEPYFVNAYILLMKIKEKTHQVDAAIEFLEDYIVLDDLNPLIFYHLGRLAFKKGDIESAKQNFKRATDLDDSYDDAFVMLFKSIIDSDTTEDIKAYTEHIDVKDLSPKALHLLGTIEATNENDDNAMKYYELANQYLKDDVEFLSDYYFYLTEIRDDKRKDILNRLIQLEPTNPEWQLELEHIRGEEDGF